MGMKYRELCVKYGMHKSTVSGIVNGKLYASVGEIVCPPALFA